MKDKQKFGPCTLQSYMDSWILQIPLNLFSKLKAEKVAGDQVLLVKEIFIRVMGHEPWSTEHDDDLFSIEFPRDTTDNKIIQFVDLLHQSSS